MTNSDQNRNTSADEGDYIQAFMDARPVDFTRAVLIVVDMQYATAHRHGALGRRLQEAGSNVGGYRFNRIEHLVVPNIKRLLRHFRHHNQEVVYLTVGAAKEDCSDAPAHMKKMFLTLNNYAGSPDHNIIEELEPEPHERVINKTSIGAFASTGLDHLLRALGKDQLYMTGVSTNMCVETTAREAADRGYAVTLLEDGCATTHEDLHNAALTNFQRLFGRVLTTNEVLDELQVAQSI